MKGLLFAGALLVMMFSAVPTFSADLVGEWVSQPGKGSGALSGAPQHGTRPAGKHFNAGDLSWVLKVSSQEGSGFHGEWCSPKKCEELVGVVRRDGTLLMVDEDSTFFATMHGDEMELCVVEPGKDFRVAACHVMKKK